MDRIDRFFTCKHDQDIALLIPDNDTLPLDRWNNVMEIYRDEFKVILRVRMDEPCVRSIIEQTEIQDPLSIEAVEMLDIAGSYVGTCLEDVFVRWPELAGDRVVGQDEDGVDVMAPIVSRTEWS